MKDIPLLRNQKIFLLALAALLNTGFILWFAASWHFQERQLEQTRTELVQALKSPLDIWIEDSTATLHELAPHIRAADGKINQTQAIINNHVTRAGERLRIAWSDADMQLRVGTAIGLFGLNGNAPDAIDLGHRDYIQAAAENPGEIVIGSIKPHAVTGRSFFAVAMGIATPEGDYLGCLASIIDVSHLQKIMQAIAADAPVWVKTTLAHGGVVFETGAKPHGTIFTDDLGRFAVQSAVETAAKEAIWHHSMQRAALWLLGVNAVLGFLYWAIYRAYVRPLRELAATFLTLPAHLVPHETKDGAEITRIVDRARHIKDLLVEYHAVQSESHSHNESLKQAIGTIDSLHAEQMTFLSTVGAEMEETFTAIRRYASFLEGGLEEDYYHTDSLFLESLKDSAQNLKFLSNAFYLMCLHKAGNYHGKTEQVDMEQLCRQVAALFAESAEFRHQNLQILSEGDATTRQDESILRHVLWGVFFLLAKYADDEAELTVRITRTDTALNLTAGASACLPGHVPEVDPDMAPFFPVSLNRTRMLEDAISSHVDFAVAHYLLNHFCSGATLKAQASEGESGLGFSLQFEIQ